MSTVPRRVARRVATRKVINKEKLIAAIKANPHNVSFLLVQKMFDVADLLADLIGEVKGFRKDFKDTLPEGKVDQDEVEVTEHTTEINAENHSSMPWMQATIANDGPGAIHITINDEYITKKSPLKASNLISYDMKQRKIEKIILKCDEGESATAYITGVK